MNRSSALSVLAAAVLALGVSAIPGNSHAETLLVDRVNTEKSLLPVRGLSMGDVEARYGAPDERLDPRGGQKSQWPVINRWVYPQFVVYFERSKVIDVVARRATPGEIGPKPVR